MATASLAVTETTEILRPGSEEEAIVAFGDGTDVVVVGGGTIVDPRDVVPPAAAGKARSCSRMRASRDHARRLAVTIGAMTPIAELVGMPAPLGPCAANIADLEIRAAATVGGNLCAGAGYEAPRGDLQGAFLALGATVRSAGEGGITDEPLESFLTKRGERLALSISYDEPAAGAFAGLDRPHTHDYTALGRLWCARRRTGRSGSRRPERAGTACGSRPRRPPPETPRRQRQAALNDVSPHDDALASAWYRTKVLPVLVRRVLTDLKESA